MAGLGAFIVSSLQSQNLFRSPHLSYLLLLISTLLSLFCFIILVTVVSINSELTYNYVVNTTEGADDLDQNQCPNGFYLVRNNSDFFSEQEQQKNRPIVGFCFGLVGILIYSFLYDVLIWSEIAELLSSFQMTILDNEQGALLNHNISRETETWFQFFMARMHILIRKKSRNKYPRIFWASIFFFTFFLLNPFFIYNFLLKIARGDYVPTCFIDQDFTILSSLYSAGPFSDVAALGLVFAFMFAFLFLLVPTCVISSRLVSNSCNPQCDLEDFFSFLSNSSLVLYIAPILPFAVFIEMCVFYSHYPMSFESDPLSVLIALVSLVLLLLRFLFIFTCPIFQWEQQEKEKKSYSIDASSENALL